MPGWTVLLPLKQNPAIRHIPVQMSTLDEDRPMGRREELFAFITKPITTEGLKCRDHTIKDYAAPRRKRLLVVEDNPCQQLSIANCLDMNISLLRSQPPGAKRCGLQLTGRYDCAVLDFVCPICLGSRSWSSCAIPLSERYADRRLHRKRNSSEEDARPPSLARSVVAKRWGIRSGYWMKQPSSSTG